MKTDNRTARHQCAVALALGLLCTSALAQHPWSMRNATAARTGQSTYPGATIGTLDWRFFVAGSVNQFAVAQDGSIYLGNVFDQDVWSNENYVYALTSKGELKWRVKVTPYNWGAAQSINGSPALDSQGNIVVPSTSTQLIKFSPNGDPLWTFQGSAGIMLNSSPAVLFDDSIRHTIFPQGLLGLANNGASLFTGPGNSSGTVAVAPSRDMAIGGWVSYEPHGALDLQYFNADGTLRWQLTSEFGTHGTPIFGPDGTLYAPFLGRAFYPNSTNKWDNGIRANTAALGTNGVLYLAHGGVIAVDAATGTRLWSVPIPGSVLDDPAIDSAGNIFLTTSSGFLWSVGATGTVNWNTKLCERFVTGPVIGSTGNVLACGVDNYKYFVFNVK